MGALDSVGNGCYMGEHLGSIVSFHIGSDASDKIVTLEPETSTFGINSVNTLLSALYMIDILRSCRLFLITW